MKNKSLSLVLLNTITLVIMLFANYASTSGMYSNKNVADVSHKYDTLFAPAGYAFIIWGVIFLLALSFVIYQWVLLKTNDSQRYVQRIGIWFTVSNIANAGWLYCWLNEQLGLSVICIFILLISLIILTIHLRLELDDVPVRNIFFVWWPVTFYLGWIMVATIACVASWLTSIGWAGIGISQSTWTIISIVIACLLYLIIIVTRNMREAAVVGIWAFIAIAVRQWNNHNGIVWTALLSSLILAIAISAHFYKNRNYSIGLKLKRGEW
ncbi:hypothetical protein FW778_15900 [Ginsengibacter hankyongi]|uniref:Tryptophan-rich sensory protein n=1 Tax=Ginsengibacter hankyongi TaxID=2607284 RepID=A0A5J5ICV0_9BACT|nr:hypothetical protein [Ginsengibacter hankyongi]KAA9037577.1 hypothetical protein FW778_15900 [Ginsengibacter hankyongi]